MLAAGAIGWTGLDQRGWEEMQSCLYLLRQSWSPRENVNTSRVKYIIMRFTIGAIAAFDDHGIRYDIIVYKEVCDKNSQQLNHSWRRLLRMLGAIGVIQFGALCYLLASVNPTIFRGESFFSTAMLLKPVLDLVGNEHGVVARSGGQIRYDYEDAPNGEPKKVDIPFQHRETGHSRKKQPSSEYR